MSAEIEIIAELGINHCGNIKTLEEMIFQAKLAGADWIKLQKRTVEIVYAGELDKPRNDGNPYGWKTYGEQKRGLEFNREQYKHIDALCKEYDIPWFASAWDEIALQFLEELQVDRHKIASAMVTHGKFVDAVARCGKFTWISTGGCTWEEIGAATAIFKRRGCPFGLMHCVAEYPVPDERANLRAIEQLRGHYPSRRIGYSGHEVGLLPSILAMALGAEAIERHVTLDRSMYGSDQSASLEMIGLRRLCNYARVAPAALGDGVKTVSEKERQVMDKLRYWL